MATAAAPLDLEALRRQVDIRHRGLAGAPAPLLPVGVAEIDRQLGGGLARHGLHEAAGPGAVAFAALLAGRIGGQIIWIRTSGQVAQIDPYALAPLGLAAEKLLLADAPRQETAWAFEQALRSGAASVVIAETAAAPDFTASRRLHLAARENGVLGLLLPAPPLAAGRLPASAAETRWRIAPAPAPDADPWAASALRLDLLKNKKGPLGHWTVDWDSAAGRFRLSGHPPGRLIRSSSA